MKETRHVFLTIYTSKYKYTSITIILLCFWISYSLTIRQIVCFFQISSLPDRSFFRKWISSMILKVNVTKQIEISVSLFNVNCNIFSSCISLERVFFQIWVYKKLIMIKFSLSMPTSRTNYGHYGRSKPVQHFIQHFFCMFDEMLDEKLLVSYDEFSGLHTFA